MAKNRFNKGDLVFFSAFLKKDRQTFYMCRGEILSVPFEDTQTYKVMIKEVAATSIDGRKSKILNQATLINLEITKKTKELNKEIPVFMKPKAWIKIVEE